MTTDTNPWNIPPEPGPPDDRWRRAWVEGYQPLLSTRSLQVLRDALASNDPALMQGATAYSDDPLLWDSTVRGACALGFCAWKGEGLRTVSDIEGWFIRLSCEVDQRMGVPGGSSWFTNFFDDQPLSVVRPALLALVEQELQRRGVMPCLTT